jgi:hypothetical protein
VVGLLAASIIAGFATPVSALFRIDTFVLRAGVAGLVFLSPVFFASLIFAQLIKKEKNLYQAYGSNTLGAAVGGACEYLSLLVGFKYLLFLTLAFYLTAWLFLSPLKYSPAYNRRSASRT